jgi:ATP-dependent protease HslVU (ClpYQ) peptidase subunit
MTCIVGVVEGDRIFMGGDSSATSGNDELSLRADQKVFRTGDFLIGFAGSFRAGQLMRYAFDPPKRPARMDVHRYMVTHFVDAMREALKRGGSAKRDHEEELIPTSILVGYRGRLYQINSDYDVGEAVDAFDAVGSGSQPALGALVVTHGMEPRKRIRGALEAAERFSQSVRRPFYVQALEGKPIQRGIA